MRLSAEEPISTAKVVCRRCNSESLSEIDNAAAQVLKLVGAETRSSRYGEFVFVDEAPEEVAPMHMKIPRWRAGCDG
jgi:hypothetical protein